MPRRSTRETPFSMIYGTKAVIPSKIKRSSMRISNFTADRNDANLAKDLDLLEERWEMALIKLADYQQKLAQRYDQNVRLR